MWNIYGVINPSFMMNNFSVSWTSLINGRFWTLITSVFSHQFLWHIFINMFVFVNFGIIVENYLGPMRFITFYLFAGMMGSLIHCLVCAYILDRPNLLALGASGAISGVVLLFALLYPQEKIYLFAIIPIPAIWGAILITGIDVLGLLSQAKGISSAIGFGAHLGGAMAGLIYYFILRLGPAKVL